MLAIDHYEKLARKSLCMVGGLGGWQRLEGSGSGFGSLRRQSAS